jgi:hypothetical protein
LARKESKSTVRNVQNVEIEAYSWGILLL